MRTCCSVERHFVTVRVSQVFMHSPRIVLNDLLPAADLVLPDQCRCNHPQESADASRCDSIRGKPEQKKTEQSTG